MTDLHVTAGEALTAERWNALVDLASGKSRPLESRFTVPTRARSSGSVVAAVIIGGVWTEHNSGSPYYKTEYWTTNGTLEENGDAVVVRSPSSTKPSYVSGRVLAWKNGSTWEMINAPKTLTMQATGTVSGNDLILEFYLD